MLRVLVLVNNEHITVLAFGILFIVTFINKQTANSMRDRSRNFSNKDSRSVRPALTGKVRL